MIIITGATEHISKALINKLNNEGYNDLILVDEPGNNESFEEIKHTAIVRPSDLEEFIAVNQLHIEFVYHVANNPVIFDEAYARSIWKSCVAYGLPLVYTHTAMGATASPDETMEAFRAWASTQERIPYFLALIQLPVDFDFGTVEEEAAINAFRLLRISDFALPFENHELISPEESRFNTLADALYFLLDHRKASGAYLLVKE